MLSGGAAAMNCAVDPMPATQKPEAPRPRYEPSSSLSKDVTLGNLGTSEDSVFSFDQQG